MNKKLLVVAIGAALAAPAFAQSSNVTLYGRINTVVESNDSSASGAKGTGREVGIRSYSSRLGVKGVEDLGGGLKGVFGLEAGLSSDNGDSNNGTAPVVTYTFVPSAASGVSTGTTTASTSASGFGQLRNVYVGLDTGSTGRLVIGRLDGAINAPMYNQVFGVIDALGYDAGSFSLGGSSSRSLGGITAITVNTTPANQTLALVQRKSNSIGYDVSPMAGVAVSARLSLAGTENSFGTTTGENNNRTFELAGNYTAGPLKAGLGFEKGYYSQDSKEGANKFGFDSRIQAVAGYDFGVAKLGASFARNKIEASGTAGSATNPTGVDTSGNEYALSATVPLKMLSPKASFVANVAQRDLIGLAGTDGNFNAKRKQYAYGARYDFTARTQAYLMVGYVNASTKTSGNEEHTLGLGVRHNF